MFRNIIQGLKLLRFLLIRRNNIRLIARPSLLISGFYFLIFLSPNHVFGQFSDGYFNIPALTCSFEPEFPDLNNFNIRLDKEFIGDVPGFVNPFVIDIDGDGKPEVVTLGVRDMRGRFPGDFAPRITKDIRIFNGQTGSLIRDIPTPFLPFEGNMPIAIADFLPNPGVEIVVATSHFPITTPAPGSSDPTPYGNIPSEQNILIIYSAMTGAELYRSTDKYGINAPVVNPCQASSMQMSSGAAPGLADFNNDGRSEIYIYNEIFNDHLVKLGDGGLNGQGISFTNKEAASPGLSVAANFIGGDNLELAAGNTLYLVNITNPNSPGGATLTPRNFTATIDGRPARDGFTSIADIDLDGELDIVVTTSKITVENTKEYPCLSKANRYVYVWNPRSNSLIASAILEQVDISLIQAIKVDENRTGVAFIGDVKSDGKPYIGVTSPKNVEMFEYNGSSTLNRIWRLPTSDRSGMTMITMFDFNQDGTQEIVYRDEETLRIINGASGGTPTTLTSIPVPSATALEGAIVADVDGDGEAEILTVKAKSPTIDPFYGVFGDLVGRIQVFKSNGLPWAPARSTWNQHAYFNLNILDDRTIPTRIPKPSELEFDNPCNGEERFRRPLNNFLVQSTFFNDQGCPTVNIGAMDATIDILEAKYTCVPGQIEVRYTVSNLSPDQVIPNSLQVAFFYTSGNPSNPTLNFIQSTITNVGIGLNQTSPILSVTLNGAPIDPFPNTLTLVGFANNDGTTTFEPIPECDFTNNEDQIAVISQPIFVLVNNQGDICSYETITLVPENQIENSVESDILWFQIDGSGNRVPISNTTTINGAIHTITAPDYYLTISGLTEGTYAYEIQVGCTGATDRVDFNVFPAPEPVFDFNPVLCFGENTGEIFVSSGHLSSFEYELIETGTINSTGTFSNLPAGEFSIQVTDLAHPTACVQVLPITITQPDEPLSIQLVDLVDETCLFDNGRAVISISGGTPGTAGYQLEELTRNGSSVASPSMTIDAGQFTFKGLAEGAYEAFFTDENACTTSIQFTITSLPIPEFDVQDVEICEGETAILTPELITGQPETIQYSWFLDETGGTALADGQSVDELTFDINSATGELQITGIPYENSPLTLYLEVSGDGVCPLSERIPAEVRLFELAMPAIASQTDPLCFGDETGEITFEVGNKTVADYEYQLNKGEFQDSPTFSGLAAGNYSLNVRDRANGCISTLDFTINQPEEITGTVLNQIAASCAEDNGLITVEVSGGTLTNGAEYTLILDGVSQTDLGDRLTLNSEHNFTIAGLSPGSHTLEFLDSNSCIGTLTFDVEDLEIPVFDTEDAVICEGDISGTLRPVIVTQANSTPVFEWSYEDPANPGTYIAISSGDVINGATHTLSNGELIIEGLPGAVEPYLYYLSVSGDLVCPSDPIPAAFTVKILPQVDFEVSPVSCFDGSDGEISANPTQSGVGYEYRIQGGTFSSTAIWSGLEAGIYTIEARDSEGCIASFEVEVEEPESLIQLNTPTLIRSSCDLPNGSIENLEITGGWGDYQVSWNEGSPTGTQVQGDLQGAYDLFPGEYFLTVTDALGCEEIFSFTIEESSDPVYQLVPTIDVCVGENVEIRPIHLAPDPNLPPAAPTAVKWFKGPNQTNEILSGSDGGNSEITYTIDDSDWLNPKLQIEGLPVGTHTFYFYVECTGAELETSVTILSIPKVEFETLSVSCFDSQDGKILISEEENPDFRYSLDGGTELTQEELEALDFSPGSYELVVTQAGVGCPSEPQTVEILQPDSPLSVDDLETQDPSCGASNGTISGLISGGWSAYTVRLIEQGTVLQTLSSSDGSFEFEGLLPGTFIVEIEDNRSCIIQTSELILVPGPTRIDVEDEVICEGEVAVLSPSLDPPAPGSQILWYFDAAKTQPINSSPNPASDGKTYRISSSGELSIDGLDFSDSPLTYYAEVTGGGSCTGFLASPSVTVNNNPEMTIEVNHVDCFGEKGEISITPSEGNGQFTYSLNGQDFVSESTFAVDPGVYEVFIESGGCIISESNVVVEGPSAPLTLELLSMTQPDCNESNGRIEFQIQGGYGPNYIIELFNDGVLAETLNLNSSDLVFDNLEVGEYSSRVTDGSWVITSEDYQLDPNPSDIEALPVIVCEGEEVNLVPQINQLGVNPQWTWYKDAEGNEPISSGMAEGSTSYTIQANGTLLITNLPASTDQYVFYLGVSGENICPPALLPVSVNVHPIPNLRVSNPSVVCDPTQTVDLTEFIEGFNPELYDYEILSPAGPMRVEDIDAVDMTGDYIVSNSLKGLNCWSPNQRIKVLIAETELIPEFQYEADLGGGNLISNQEAQIFENVYFEDLSQGEVLIWNWDFGDGNASNEQNPVHQFKNKGSFTVTLTTIDEYGCVAQYTRNIEILDEFVVIVPNAFTPNGVKNQFFKPMFRGIVEMEFYIFNTWGELIYQSDNIEDPGWDGEVNNVKAIPGNYVYKGIFISATGERLEKSGVFILIR